MHVEPEYPYSGFLGQFRRTRVIECLASVSRTFFCRILPHLKEGRKEGTYLFDQTTIVNTIHIYENAMVRRLSLRLNIAASATARWLRVEIDNWN